MTEIEFHFHVPDKLLYSCRLLRKVYRTGQRVVVTGELELLGRLDQLLWTFSPAEFVPHGPATAGMSRGTVTAPVWLAERAGDCPADSVLVNLGQRIPDGFERFERFIEVVSSGEEDRLSGRNRWKHYKDRGYALKQHDLSIKREAA